MAQPVPIRQPYAGSHAHHQAKRKKSQLTLWNGEQYKFDLRTMQKFSENSIGPRARESVVKVFPRWWCGVGVVPVKQLQQPSAATAPSARGAAVVVPLSPSSSSLPPWPSDPRSAVSLSSRHYLCRPPDDGG
uniref:Uncharacterized protein n=1 Tax=Anopheles merus TaxID=30066 RepID=A0A182V0G8_ANOME